MSQQGGLELEGKLVAVIGAGATGRALIEVLKRRGAKVRLYDRKERDGLDLPDDLLEGVELRTADAACRDLEECDLVAPSPGVPAHHPALDAAVRRGQPVLSEIEIAYRIARASIIGITGTNGKTTTTFMAAAMLRAAGRRAVVAGNALAGGAQYPLILAAQEEPEEAWIAAEISSFQLEWIDRFAPAIAVLTNVTDDHGDRYSSTAEYAAAKARLVENLGPQQIAVVNLADPAARRIGESCRARRYWFSLAPHSLEGAWCGELKGEPWLMARIEGAEIPVAPASAVSLPGRHNIENALAAALAALGCGCPPSAIEAALRSFSGVRDRLEPVASIDGVLYVNNSMCTNVDAAVRSLEAYDSPLIVIAGGRAKTDNFDAYGEALAQRARALVVLGEAGPAIAEAARAHGLSRILNAGSMADAVRQAAAEAEPGNLVLLAPACASHDMYGGFEQRGADFRRQVERLREERDAADATLR